MIVVVDASVALKWFFQSREDEADCGLALAILSGIDEGRIRMRQPPHFIAEMTAVLAREKPKEAQDDLFDLLAIESRFAEEPEIYATAMDLAIRCRHHLFDTLYHAVALNTPGAALVTADRRYYDKAASFGRITLLSDVRLAC
ncbi:type II toxin-antitoxin system VapC family toxin [Methylosarcina fibrata]|uniref:type II toxin-antitoxin system VapC family toxin n=1 Tax=Methylosarcina fibrata TaxID=105972 RepID=UPI000367BC00|nr:type II toxin-antitoxin system VapC family toxin [Methylosarcina fibrata]